MALINISIQSGRVTRDPEVRALPNGTTVTEFSIAQNYGSGDSKKVNFFDFVAFGDQNADYITKYVSKGREVTVQSQERFRSWETDGQKRSKIDHVVENVQLGAMPQGTAAAPAEAEEPVAA